jgi:hypothetical protein
MRAARIAALVLSVLSFAAVVWAQDVPAGAITSRSDVHLDLQSLPGTGLDALTAIGTAVRAKMTQIRTCYDNAVRTTPNVAGDLRLLIVTTPRGTVASATVAEDHLNNAGVARCVIRVLKTLPRGLPASARGHIVLRFNNTMARGMAKQPSPAPPSPAPAN